MVSPVTLTRRRLSWVWAVLGAAAFFFPSPTFSADSPDRLASGEIVSFCEDVPGTSQKRGEVKGVIDAPPEIVWQVITDVNNYKDFMPRTLKSMAVRPERLKGILEKKPVTPKEVEALLDPAPPDPASYRVPARKYLIYLYSLLDFPWPISNRWYIIKILQDETLCARHIYKSNWSLEIGNLRENCGEWLLEPFGNNKTKVTYRLLTDPGGHLPNFLTQKGTAMTMPQIISSIRKRAGILYPR